MQQQETIGARLRRLRIGAKYTQYEVADALGIARCSYALWEQGRRTPRLKHLREVAKLYGVSMGYIIDGESA